MSRPAQRGSFRIIGGQWRRRRLDFVTNKDVRPSPDRVRETLFNWLAYVIEGKCCLDLYAGSGALGLEALSRGAGRVIFVDHERDVIENIRSHLDKFGAIERSDLAQAEAARFLAQSASVFDIVFLDPPYRQGKLPEMLQLLVPRLALDHRVYIESETPSPALPPDWEVLKSARAGQVSYALVRYSPNPHNS